MAAWIYKNPETGYTATIAGDAQKNQMIENAKKQGIDVSGWFTQTGGTTQNTSPAVSNNTGGASSIPSGISNLSGGGGLDFSSLFSQLTNSQPSFKAPSESELSNWASTYANAQIDPLITAIQNSLTKQLASQETARSEVEAQYAGLPQKYASMLEEARRSALESAIARGMGRSGVVDWQTAKLSSPIIQQQAKDEADKTAALAKIANNIAALNTTAQDSITSAEAQRGNLAASRMGELQQWVAQMNAASGQNSFNNALSLANLYNNNQASSINTILQLLPLFMGGS